MLNGQMCFICLNNKQLICKMFYKVLQGTL
jgi:hypothetical protein